ncbi:MAG TPA: TlpA disulfide reductase family protein [Planctomycetota bacterium]|nr:TlpA disulfide reductase family protein [Planctomycetota bacterium]
MLFAFLPLLAALQAEPTVQLTLVTKGASSKIGHYMPQRASMSEERPAAITQVPDGLSAAMYGLLPIGPDAGTCFILDEPAEAPARLFVDSNANGNLTDDPAAEWSPGKNKDGTPSKMYQGNAMVDIGEPGKPVLVNLALYRFDKNDPQREALKSTLLFYRDYAYEGEMTFGEKKHKVILADEMASGDFRGKGPELKESKEGSGVVLLIDVNDNGKFESRGESYDVRKPFNLSGTTWELADLTRAGGSLRAVKSAQTVAEILPPPDHSVGMVITPFEAKDTEGKSVSFPADFKGKVVLLDFWATWCGPCMQEMPNVVRAYEKFHAAGFEILGVSLDNEKSIEKMPDVMANAKMTWRQVADGKYWQAEIAQIYAINSIPATFLVDGTTGKIIGAGLRGEKLDEALAKALGVKPPKQ